MRFRLTVQDDAARLRTDVVVDCEPADPTGAVLSMITAALPVRGLATADGAPVDPRLPVARSPLLDGVLLRFRPGPAQRPAARTQPRARILAPTPATPATNGTPTLRVVSGPSAGAELPVPPDQPVVIGRAPSCELVLDDDDVSRRHAELRIVDGQAMLTDLGSRNGTWLDAEQVAAPRPLPPGRLVQLGGSRLVIETPQRTGAVLARGEDGALLLNRRYPDRRRPFEPPTIQLPSPPPDLDEPRRFPLLTMLLPMAVAIVLVIVLRNPIYLLFGLLSPVMFAGNWWSDRKHRQRREQRMEGNYGEKLRAAKQRVDAAADDEDADLRRRWPDPETVMRIAGTPRVELWSRRPGDEDWLGVRLGVADRPASVEVTGELPADWAHPMLRRVPSGARLDEHGVLGVAGPPDWLRRRLDWIAVQLAVLHSPDELQVAVLAPGARELDLGWLRWLPHLRAPDGSVLAAWDAAGVDGVLRALGAEADRRAAIRQQPGSAPPDRHVLVLLVGAAELGRRQQVVELLARGPALGFRFVCTEVDDRLLPDRCGAVLQADPEGGSEAGATLRADRAEPLRLDVDELPAGAAELLARGLAPLRRVGETAAGAGGLPDSVRFVDLAGGPDAEAVRAGWRSAPECTEVIIGADGDGPVAVDIARDGPHGVVAGTSGAGKSELLQTLVAGLVLANDPAHLNIIFMDYKGGATFTELNSLPHVVGSVTNLDERLAARALSSLRAELTRRQAQLADVGAASLAEYRRLATAGRAPAPFPRLLIVVDELAEMKDQLPELVDGLVNVARVGRSLGVHLMLATQKPAGVVDSQIRANVDLRVCLRVAGEGDSIDVIDVPDAARIPKERPGRAYLVRGGSSPRLVQTARVSTIRRADTATPRAAAPLPWYAVWARPPARATQNGLVTDLQVLVGAVREAAHRGGLAAPYRPWLPPLPEVLALDAPVFKTRQRFTAPLGLWDRPERQRQEPLPFELGTGHLAVVGSARTGRTGALRAVAAGLATGAAPTELHLHVVDGSGGLAGLAALPHTGVVADPDDPQRLERLLTRLVELVRDRRRLLTQHAAAGVAELWAHRPQDAPPHVVLLVDDWAGLADGTETAAQTALFELLSGGLAAGVTVCVAGDERLLRARVIGRFTHRLCLRLNNPADGTVLGLDVRHLPAGLPPGRALYSPEGTEVQVPLLSPEPSGPAQAAALAALAGSLRAAHGTPAGPDAPLRLDPLPDRITLADADRTAGPRPSARHVLLGVGGDRLAGRWADLDAGHLLIAGPARSGRSTAAAAVAASAAAAGLRVLLAAPRPGAVLRRAGEHGVGVLTTAELAAALDHQPADLVVVDDADQLGPEDPLAQRLVGLGLAADGGPALAVSGLIESFGFGARGLVKAARSGPTSAVVLLSPPNHLAAADVGVTLDRGGGFTGPPGRGYLVTDGEPGLGQVPEPG